MAEAGVYLEKSAESLASAEDDYAAARYNSCARSAYHAAFQASVAAPIQEGAGPFGRWGHGYVQAQFSGILVGRRKLYSRGLRSVLARTLKLRQTADYEASRISQRSASRILAEVRDLVSAARSRASGTS